jgi:hypothetical protein
MEQIKICSLSIKFYGFKGWKIILGVEGITENVVKVNIWLFVAR